MGYKEVSGAREYRGWRDWSEGDYVEGVYADNGVQDGDYGEQQWFDIEVEKSNFGFDTSKKLRLNGNGALNPKMENIEHGTKVKIQFDGYDILAKGKFKGKEFADVKVFEEDSEASWAATTTAETKPVDYSRL